MSRRTQEYLKKRRMQLKDLASGWATQAWEGHAPLRAAEAKVALRRIDTGEHGRCAECSEEISRERLEAKPEATRCMSCQEAWEGMDYPPELWIG